MEPLKQCCNSCPFLVEMNDKPNINNYQPDFEKGQTNHFTQDNIDRLWNNGLKNGEFMICHQRDPNAEEYGGNNAKPNKAAVCMGSFIAQYKHYQQYEAILTEQQKTKPNIKPETVHRLYEKAVGPKTAMTLFGIMEWVLSVAMGRTNLFGGMPIPKSHSETRPLRGATGDKLFENKPDEKALH